eukprot:gnl/MRDRNA2_/MRDRNA2_45087_c0_seq1.p1 gnl/MRDRNA2_/MRDRNA2_45087_c0~~gnl/MRDRNA2_/MRDRNA2_45087_c0_seq1.p1  ORF type:complete len:105 (-),score=4.31 gnl/MRDRNA2_/MRDRNA2_45087_c0_seq1:32-346(-)
MKEACKTYQYALSTRTGTECVSHMLRATLQADPDNTLLFLDGMKRTTLYCAAPCWRSFTPCQQHARCCRSYCTPTANSQSTCGTTTKAKLTGYHKAREVNRVTP